MLIRTYETTRRHIPEFRDRADRVAVMLPESWVSVSACVPGRCYAVGTVGGFGGGGEQLACCRIVWGPHVASVYRTPHHFNWPMKRLVSASICSSSG
jgi:hypothetical protein